MRQLFSPASFKCSLASTARRSRSSPYYLHDLVILEARIKLLTEAETLRGAGVDKRNEQTRNTGYFPERIQMEMMDLWRI